MAENRLRFLVTNDDGIYAPGLKALVDELSELGHVVVVAPDRNQSGVGNGLTWQQPIRVREETAAFPRIRAYAVEGTPVDCVILAHDLLFGDAIDLVVSGINRGPNLGEMDTLLSGTFSAARHSNAYGLSGLAVSLCSMKANEAREFHPAARMAGAIVAAVGNDLVGKGMLLNVNVPGVSLGEIKGVAVTKLAKQRHGSKIKAEARGDSARPGCYWLTLQENAQRGGKGSDVWAIRNDLVSLTPLAGRWDRHARRQLEERVAAIHRALLG